MKRKIAITIIVVVLTLVVVLLSFPLLDKEQLIESMKDEREKEQETKSGLVQEEEKIYCPDPNRNRQGCRTSGKGGKGWF